MPNWLNPNVQLARCQVGIMASWQNDKLKKWQFGSMAIWQNAIWPNHVGKMTCCQNAIWPNLVVKMTCWQSAMLAKWINVQSTVPNCQNPNVKLARWQVVKIAIWQNGNLAEWWQNVKLTSGKLTRWLSTNPTTAASKGNKKLTI